MIENEDLLKQITTNIYWLGKDIIVGEYYKFLYVSPINSSDIWTIEGKITSINENKEDFNNSRLNLETVTENTAFTFEIILNNIKDIEHESFYKEATDEIRIYK